MKFIQFKRLSLVLVLLCSTWMLAFAQNPATGIVTDAEGMPLQGVTVLVKGSTRGAITDLDGKYSLQASNGEVLQFSFIGFVTQDIPYAGKAINTSMKEDTQALEEVMVIGYGQVKKSDATGSLSTVSSKEFSKGNIVSPTDLLTGKSAGVQITSNGGAPGSGSTIRIRGGASLTASNDPLIVVDGVPLGVDLNSIDPNTIESFTVLKDASSTAIYGARATNGVIIITTKKGTKGAPFQVDFSSQTSVSTPSGYVNVMNGNQFADYVINEFGMDSKQAGILDLYTDPSTNSVRAANNTNWQKQIYRNALGLDNNFTMAGGKLADYVPYRLSGGYNNSDGILKTDNYKRGTGALMLTPTFLENHLALTVNVKGAWIDKTEADEAAINDAINFDPTQAVYSGNDNYGGYYTSLQASGLPINSKTPFNPLARLYMRDAHKYTNTYTYNLQANYKVHGFEDLSFNINAAEESSKETTKGYIDPNSPTNYQLDADGNLNGGSRWNNEFDKGSKLLEMYSKYEHQFSHSKFDIQGGYSWQHYYENGSDYTTNYAETITNTDKKYATELFLISFFGRMNYSLYDKYLFTATVRRDGTSRFSPDNRWGTFPAFALAWKIKEESFLKDVKDLSTLKLRVGYGITGQQNISDNYVYLAKYTLSQQTAGYYFNGQWINTNRPGGYDSNIKWEQTATANIGLDYGFFNDRLTGAIDVYNRKTTDLVNTIPVAAGSNLTNFITTNVGSLENKGIEFSFTARPIVSDTWYWEVGFNVTHNQNKITKLTAVDDPNYKGIFTGGIQGSSVGPTIQINSVGHAANSYYVYRQAYDENKNPIEGVYEDRNHNGILDDDDKYVSKKSSTPDYYYGITSLVKYKDWSFNFQGRAQTGNYVYNNVSVENGIKVTTSVLDGGSGFLRNRVSPVTFDDRQLFSDIYIQNAAFFKMDNMTLSYDIHKICEGLSNVRLSATVQNVFTLTPYKGLDPEVYGGIDYQFYPRPRVFLLGLNITFK